MKKTPYHHGNLEQALLQAGLMEARRNGLRNLGVTHLAKQVSVSPMAVYRHFPSGESLRAGIAQQAREELAHRMLDAVSGETDLKKRFLAIGRAYIEFGLSEPGLFSVAFLDCEDRPKRDDNPSAWIVFYDAILDLCNAGIIQPQSVDGVAAFAWSIVHGYSSLAGGKDPVRPSASSAVIDDLLERTWSGVTKPDEGLANGMAPQLPQSGD